MDYYNRNTSNSSRSYFNSFDKFELELQYQEQQELYERELQQRSIHEQSYYDNSNSKPEEFNHYKGAYEKAQLIKNINTLNNINYNNHNNINYNTNESSNQKTLLYELKQYEHFTNNSLDDSTTNDLNNFKLNNHSNHSNYNNNNNNNNNINGASRKNHLNNSGHNYNNNILNYNNSYYKINNINNYNCIRNQSSPSSYYNHQKKYYNKHQQDKLLLNDRMMDKEETIVERSQLVSTGSNANGHNVIIHNFTNNNNNQNANHNNNTNNRIHDEDEEQNNVNPCNHRSQHYTQIIAALAVSLGPLAAGLGKGYSSPAIASLQELHIRNRETNNTSFSVSDQEASWVASLSLLGALFGGMFGGLAMQYGRKKVLALMSLPFSISWILTVFAKSVETMFMTAFIGGFCCAIVSMVTQVYISEISSPDIRGFLSAIQKVSGHLGILISYLLGAYLDWRQLAMLVSVAPMMLFVTVIYIPETPSFLVLKGRDEDAYRSLQWLRGPNKNVELELDTIRNNIRTSRFNKDNSSNLSSAVNHSGMSFKTILANIKSVLKNARLVRPVLITCGLMIFQRFTGANSFGFYAVKIFRQTFSGMNPHGGAVAVAFVQLLASMLSGLLIDTVGRIPLLITSSVTMSLSLASFGSFVHYEQNRMNDLEAAAGNNDWIPLLCVLIFTIAYSLGISPISWLLIGELFPLEYRGIGSSIATSFSYFCAFLGVKTFVDFQEMLGLDGAFWLFACISCVGLFFVIMVVPETKGKDLDEMDPKFMRTITINR